MNANHVKSCEYCHSLIAAGHRWVREKTFDARTKNADPVYQHFYHFHAEPFAGEEESCWEKQQMARELARAAMVEAGASRLQGVRLVA